MSKIQIDNFVNQANEQMSSYVVLLDYHYKNLPIKAEPVSLLPIEVQLGDQLLKVEEVATVSQPEWNQLMLIPNHEEYIPHICKSIPLSHPEFKIEVTRYVIEKLGQEQRVVLLTMPEVDDERYDLLTNGVKSLATQCRGFVESKFRSYDATASLRLRELTPFEIDEARQLLSEKHKKCEEDIDQKLKEKLEEIETAHNDYLQKQELKNKQSEEAAEEENVVESYSFMNNEAE